MDIVILGNKQYIRISRLQGGNGAAVREYMEAGQPKTESHVFTYCQSVTLPVCGGLRSNSTAREVFPQQIPKS